MAHRGTGPSPPAQPDKEVDPPCSAMSKVPSHVDTSYNSDLETTTTELDRGLSRLVRLTTAILSGISPQSGCSGIVGQPPALKQQVHGLAQECLKRTVLVQPHLAEPCRATSGAKYLRYAPRPSFGAPGVAPL